MHPTTASPQTAPTASAGPERRRAARFPILQKCFAWPGSAEGGSGLRCIAFDISAVGIGLALPMALPPGSTVTVRGWGLPDAPPLRAQVAHAKRVEGVWFTGCAFPEPISDEELSRWTKLSLGWQAQEWLRRPTAR